MLATKIRPRSFSEIIGQDIVIKGLKSYFKNGNLPNNIYLLGTSGCGKTTIAYIIASILNCEHPIKNEKGDIDACGNCSHCLDIKEEKYNTIKSISGADLTADVLRDLESELNYSTLMSNNKIIVLNEVQQSSCIKRLLEIIEQSYKNTYFILTSTDKSKFSNATGKENRVQETQALRSRGAVFNLKPISTKQIGEYLFKLVQEYDPTETKVPDSFIEQVLPLIAENSNQNLRLGINDLEVCLTSEAFDVDSALSLLGYQDTTNYMNYLLQLCSNNNTVLNDIHELGDDTYGFFVYCWKVLTEIQLRHILGKPFDEEYKEKNYLQLIKLPEFKSVYKMFMVLGKEVGGNYYNGSFNNVLLGSLMELMIKPPEGVKRKVLPENK